MARWYPSSQRPVLFFSLECGSKLFSQPLQRATTGPWSLGSTEGVEPNGRGAYVTQHAQEGSGGKRKRTGRKQKEGEKEEEESAFERCFQLLDKGPCFVKTTRKEKAQQQKRKTKNEGGAKPAMSFIRLGGWGNAFKSFRPISKKNLSTFKKTKQKQIKDLATNCETGGVGARSSTVIHFWVAFVDWCTFAFFLRSSQTDESSAEEKN